MAGLYIHIPFCARRCLYCDFYSTTLLSRREEYLSAVVEEIARRKDEAGEPIRTIYIGGGTPSQLTPDQILRILRATGTEEKEEITLEVNPADLSESYLSLIKRAGIQRLSMGVQSFQDSLLQLIGRRHNAAQAVKAIRMAQEAGFDNLSIDLIYAMPGQTRDIWMTDLNTAMQLGIQHLSSYGLMYEEGTALTRMRDEGRLVPIDEDTENEMYDDLCRRAKEAGFIHYEVSNFARPGYEAVHNSHYWDGTPYIGIGAGAHSYVKGVRSWNPDNLDAYIQGITARNLHRESEMLSETDRYNEYIMLGLRTSRGIATDRLADESKLRLSELEQNGLIERKPDGNITATQSGLHVLNSIIETLMLDAG